MDQQVKNFDSFTSSLTTELMGSDTAYFEAAALIENIEAASIARMPGLESLAAGAVIQKVDAERLPADLSLWIAGFEKKLHAHGVVRSRVYLQKPIPRLERALGAAGYCSRVELAVIAPSGPECEVNGGVRLKPVQSEADWAEKLSVHQSVGNGPDGHLAVTGDWVSMERKKCESGFMRPFLICMDGEAVGAVNAAPRRSLLRLKNLVVVENSRLNKVGLKTLGLISGVASRAGKTAAGAFVLDGKLFERMYSRAGYRIVGRQTEWVRKLA